MQVRRPKLIVLLLAALGACLPAARAVQPIHPCAEVIRHAPPVWASAPGGLGRVVGAVYDPSGQPLRAMVLLRDTMPASVRGVVSDHLGQFVLDSLPAGNQYLQFDLIGYRRHIIEVVVVKGQTDTVCAVMQERVVPTVGLTLATGARASTAVGASERHSHGR